MAAGGGHEPNLTPFIDLFSVLICFLLMTAAWTQLESFQIQVEKKPAPSEEFPMEIPSPEKKDEKKVKLFLNLEKNLVVAQQDEKKFSFPIDGYNIASPELKSFIQRWKKQFGDDQMLTINSGKGCTYGQLVRLYDFVNFIGWTKVVINPY